jgi:uncharacterized protein (TIRG00374 family)
MIRALTPLSNIQPPAAKRDRRKPPRWFIPTIAWAISIACLIWVFRGVDYAELMYDIRTLKWRWMAVAIILELAVYVCQAWRWNILLSPVERLPLWPTVKAIYIGVFASGVVPLRAGEIIRCYLLAFWNELPVSLAFTSGAIERVIDGLWLVAAFVFTARLLELPRYMIDGVEIMAAALALLSMVFVYVLFRKQHAHTLLARFSWGSKFAHVLDEIHRLGDWRTLGSAVAVSGIYLVLQIAAVWALILAYDLDATMWSGVAVLVILRVGTLIPNVPGNLGVFQAVIKLSLALLGIDKTTSAGFAVVAYAALTFPPIIAGALVLMLTGLNIGEVRHHAHSARRDYKAGKRPPMTQ